MPIDDDTPATKQFSLRNTIDETNSKACLLYTSDAADE